MNQELMEDLQRMLGRLNAIHAAVTVIASSLPAASAQQAASKLQEGAQRIHADLLALPVSDLQMDEMLRVMEELAHTLHTAAQRPQ